MQMIIRKFYVGNEKEAYIEESFNKKLNVIYSYENNKGKTIVLQGIMYALGNNPIFPYGFPINEYYYIVDIEFDSKVISICRKGDNFIVKEETKINFFDSVSEFKHFFNEHIMNLPTILKDGKKHLVGLELYYQLFFVGQDDRNTSKIFNTGYYNKDNFIDMLYSLSNSSPDLINLDEEKITNEIKTLLEEKKILLKKNKILKSKNLAAQYAVYSARKTIIDEQIKNVEKIRNDLIELKNKRNSLVNKKIKNEMLIKELNSLNRTLSEGKLKCMDCGSKNISFESKNEDISFDVSDIEIRKQIVNVIIRRITVIDEELSYLENSIILKQKELNELMNVEEVTMENLLFYKEDITNSTLADQRILEIDEKIIYLEDLKKKIKLSLDNIQKDKINIMNELLKVMNEFYKKVDKNGSLIFEQLFTKKGVTYSGSEGSEFYLARLYSIKKVLNLNFPIIVDSFREGELSTSKEKIIIEEFSKFPNQQIIFSATLKSQELDKYEDFTSVNAIKYESHQDSKILNEIYASKMVDKLHELLINI